MTTDRKEQICNLLKGIEKGDPASVSVVNEAKYIQHNPQTHEGSEGLAKLFKRLSESSPRVNIVRIFEDRDFVFAHTEYDFASRNIGFEIFRFEDNQAVEHWDNIQHRYRPNSSGHSMVDGETDVTDLALTESNRSIIRSFIDDALIQGHHAIIPEYLNENIYTEHNPFLTDDWSSLHAIPRKSPTSDANSIHYEKCHRLLAEGNFVLSVCEGYVNQISSSFFDLYRLKTGKIVEHWDTTEAIPPRSEWKNDNGKF